MEQNELKSGKDSELERLTEQNEFLEKSNSELREKSSLQEIQLNQMEFHMKNKDVDVAIQKQLTSLTDEVRMKDEIIASISAIPDIGKNVQEILARS